MTIKRISATVFFYLIACAGWFMLGTTTQLRSTNMSSRLGSEVRVLWGAPLVQCAPEFVVQIPGTEQTRNIMPSASAIDTDIALEYRKKGLIWYPTYRCRFGGTYTLTNEEEVAQKVLLHFAFPVPGGTYDGFSFSMDDEKLVVPVDTEEGIREIIELPPGISRDIRITYATRGLHDWRYRIDPGTGRVQNLKLTVTTDFLNIDYPEDSLSPSEAQPSEKGMTITWEAEDLITGQALGVVVPAKLNPGPLSSRITFFAPVCLLFFFVLLATVNIVWKVNIHPMHYLFTAAGFFAFHLLFAYLLDHINVHAAFALAAVTSVVMVTMYLAAALGKHFPWKIVATGQLFYLVLFSYSFFLKGMTGLTVTVGAVLTLGVLMKVTAGTDWEKVFAKKTEETLPEPTALPAEG